MSRWLQAARAAGFSCAASSASFGPSPPKPAELADVLKRVSPNSDAYEERAAIIEYDGGLPRHEAEMLAAQEQGFDDAPSFHRELVERWSAEIERFANLGSVCPASTEALKRAQAFISQGWALQAVRLGWDEVELFGVCAQAPWQRLDRKGVAFGGTVQAVTQDAVAYVGGQCRYRAQVNNDGGAEPIWKITGRKTRA